MLLEDDHMNNENEPFEGGQGRDAGDIQHDAMAIVLAGFLLLLGWGILALIAWAVAS